MKHNTVVLAARQALIFLSPRKMAVPRRLRITVWQTHSWIKKIIKLRSDTWVETQAMRQMSK